MTGPDRWIFVEIDERVNDATARQSFGAVPGEAAVAMDLAKPREGVAKRRRRVWTRHALWPYKEGGDGSS